MTHCVGCPSRIEFSVENRVIYARFCLCKDGRVAADHFHEVMCEDGCRLWCENNVYGTIRRCQRNNAIKRKSIKRDAKFNKLDKLYRPYINNWYGTGTISNLYTYNTV